MRYNNLLEKSQKELRPLSENEVEAIKQSTQMSKIQSNMSPPLNTSQTTISSPQTQNTLTTIICTNQTTESLQQK